MQSSAGMSTELRPGLLVPTHTYLTHLIAYGLGCGLIGASLMFAAKPPTVVQGPPTIVMHETETVAMAVPPSAVSDDMPAPPPVWVIVPAAGATFMKLADLGDKLPRHGKPTLSEHEYTTTSVASIADADVPPVHRAWKGTEVIVDGTCHAKVVGFAIVARLNGDTAYAGEEGGDTWTATSVMKHGAPMLVATLDGCTGKLARAATLSALIVPETITDAKLVAAATKQLFASADAKQARAAWAAWETEMQSTKHTELELGELSTQVVRHPKTGETFVSIHGTTGGNCGYADISLWGLYWLDGEKLTRVPTNLGQLLVIDGFVDLEGDGQLEVVGRPWLGTERMISRVNGDVVETLAEPFYGCPC